MDSLIGFFRGLIDFIRGTNRWILERWWLAGGVHHAALLALVMGGGALISVVQGGPPNAGAVPPALVLLGLYASEWFGKDTPDNFTDFATPLAFALLALFVHTGVALLALVLYGGGRFLYERHFLTEPDS